MKQLAMLVLFFVFSGSAFAQSAPPIEVFLIVDNGAGHQFTKESDAVRQGLFRQLVEMGRNKQRRNAKINIITTVRPRIVWAGKPFDIEDHAESIEQKISYDGKGCTDLVGAFQQIDLGLRSTTAKEVWVFIWSSLIDTGRPCDLSSVKLPQSPPSSIDFSGLAANKMIKRIFFLGVHHEQYKTWFPALERVGMMIRSRKGELFYTMAVMGETQSEVENIDLRRQ